MVFVLLKIRSDAVAHNEHIMSRHACNSLWRMEGNSSLRDTHALLPMPELNPTSETIFFLRLVYGKQVEHVPCALQIIRTQWIDINLTVNLNWAFSSLKRPFGLLSVVLHQGLIVSPIWLGMWALPLLALGHMYIFSVECRKGIVVFFWKVFRGLWMLCSQALCIV